MTAALTLGQRLALAKFMTDELKNVREKTLVPDAQAEMDSGERYAVKFGGKRAAWVSMPEPSKKQPYVSSEAALLAWASKQYPEKVGEHAEIIDPADSDLIDFLAEHYPQALRKTRRVDPYFVGDLTGALKGGGHFVTHKGEKLTEVPGITVPDPDPAVPRVALEDDAAETIGAAWLAGRIPAAELLALPVREGGEAP